MGCECFKAAALVLLMPLCSTSGGRRRGKDLEREGYWEGRRGKDSGRTQGGGKNIGKDLEREGYWEAGILGRSWGGMDIGREGLEGRNLGSRVRAIPVRRKPLPHSYRSNRQGCRQASLYNCFEVHHMRSTCVFAKLQAVRGRGQQPVCA